MVDVTIRMYFRHLDGKIEDTECELDSSYFAGVLPAIGDRFLHPLVSQGQERSDPKDRNIFTVVDRVFNPKDLPRYVALIVEERPLMEEDLQFLP